MDTFNRRLYFRQQTPAARFHRVGFFDDAFKEQGANAANINAQEIWNEAMKFVRENVFGEDDNDNGNADAEEDMYSATRSDFARDSGNKKDLRTIEQPADDVVPQKQSVQEGEEPEYVSTTEHSDGSKTVRTEKRSERDGRIESTYTSQDFDANGKLVSQYKKTSSTKTWSAKVPGGGASFSWSWNKDAHARGKSSLSDADAEDDSRQGGHGDEKRGWFWTR
jgi:hypothetical protein